MKSIFRAVLLLAFAILLAACSKAPQQQQQQQQQFSTVDVTGAPWGRDFLLTDHNGERRNLASFKGQAVVLFFGYTNCPDMCPTTLYKLATAVQKLGKDAERVQVLFVTLDPERDTPAILKQYAPAFYPTFLGLYGDEQTTDETAQEFKTFYKHQNPDASGFYTVDHMGPSFIFDPQGRLRLFASDQHSADAIAQDLRTLLKD